MYLLQNNKIIFFAILTMDFAFFDKFLQVMCYIFWCSQVQIFGRILQNRMISKKIYIFKK